MSIPTMMRLNTRKLADMARCPMVWGMPTERIRETTRPSTALSFHRMGTRVFPRRAGDEGARADHDSRTEGDDEDDEGEDDAVEELESRPGEDREGEPREKARHGPVEHTRCRGPRLRRPTVIGRRSFPPGPLRPGEGAVALFV